jgi:hypothetical protein
MSRTLISFSVLLSLPAQLLAHPGHGSTEPSSLEHYAIEPMHWMPVAGLVLGFAAAVVVARLRRRSR